jgi:hypothetical protein
VSDNRRAVIFVVRAALVAMKRCGKHICAAVNQHATIEEAVFSVRTAPVLYNEDLMQIELELRVSGVGSWQNNDKTGVRLCKGDFIVRCSYSETDMNPLPGCG